MRKLLLSIPFVSIVLLSNGCSPDGVRYEGFKVCGFSSVVKDVNETLYIPNADVLYKVNNQNILKSSKKLEDISSKYNLYLDKTNLPPAKDVIRLVAQDININFDEIKYYKLFDLSQKQSPYFFGIISYRIKNPDTFIDELVLFEKVDNNLILKDHIMINNSGLSSPTISNTNININGAYYLRLKYNSAQAEKTTPQIITYDSQNKKIKIIDLPTFVNNYYQNDIDFSIIFDSLKKTIAQELYYKDNLYGVSYSIYSEGLHVVFSSNNKIKNEELKQNRGRAPLPEGVYESIYRFYPKQNFQNFRDLKIPIDGNCTKDSF